MTLRYDLVHCRTCLAKGIKKAIAINKTETCIECRSTPCKKCGTMTTSTKSLCFKCYKPSAWKKKKEKNENIERKG